MDYVPWVCRTVSALLAAPRTEGGRAGSGGEGGTSVTTQDEREDEWSVRAVCRSTDPEDLFVEGAAQNRAKAVCTGCPVRTECLAYALDHRIDHGVWGGMTDRERRALLRRRPTVTSWRRLLEAARTEHARHVRPDDGGGLAAVG